MEKKGINMVDKIDKKILQSLLNKNIRVIKKINNSFYFYRGKLVKVSKNGIWLNDIKLGIMFVNFSDISEIRLEGQQNEL